MLAFITKVCNTTSIMITQLHYKGGKMSKVIITDLPREVAQKMGGDVWSEWQKANRASSSVKPISKDEVRSAGRKVFGVLAGYNQGQINRILKYVAELNKVNG